MVGKAVGEVLGSVGIAVGDFGVLTTSGVGIMTRYLNCAGGLVITASHNPGEYNGIKLLLDNGVAPPVRLAGQIKEAFLTNDFELADSASRGRISQNDQTDAVHIEKVLAIVEKDTIVGKKFKVVLDSVNGAGGRVCRRLLEGLGGALVA